METPRRSRCSGSCKCASMPRYSLHFFYPCLEQFLYTYNFVGSELDIHMNVSNQFEITRVSDTFHNYWGCKSYDLLRLNFRWVNTDWKKIINDENKFLGYTETFLWRELLNISFIPFISWYKFVAKVEIVFR